MRRRKRGLPPPQRETDLRESRVDQQVGADQVRTFALVVALGEIRARAELTGQFLRIGVALHVAGDTADRAWRCIKHRTATR